MLTLNSGGSRSGFVEVQGDEAAESGKRGWRFPAFLCFLGARPC